MIGNLPLSKHIMAGIDPGKLSSPNISLLYYKLADVYGPGFAELAKSQSPKDDDPKKKFLERFVNQLKMAKNAPYFDAVSPRLDALKGVGRVIDLTTATRLMFGMGNSHPLEVGFTFDWMSGLPILPGSSIKGAVREYAKTWLGWNNSDMINIFGSEKKGPGQFVEGRAVFLPAFPIRTSSESFLELDVMTPHFQDYYSDEKNTVWPTDWLSPIPLLFLVVPVGVIYQFRVADSRNLRSGDVEFLNEVSGLLKDTLTNIGIGAKTSVDYGRFE